MLIGFRNRIVVLVNWTWNYFSYDRGLRLINLRTGQRSGLGSLDVIAAHLVRALVKAVRSQGSGGDATMLTREHHAKPEATCRD